jgi:transglutaminase-like putative cysteine protease
MGCTLLFWGWRTGMVWVGAIAGGLLELSNAVHNRWEFTGQEYNRLWDICTILFLVAAAYLRLSEDVTAAAYKFFQWMPLIFYPMALGHFFGAASGVPLKAFSWFLRRKGAEGAEAPVAFGWIYLVICLVTAGATNLRDIWFYLGTAVLTGWALWSIRPRRVPTWAWCVLFAAVAGSGCYGQSRMQELQAYFENKASELFVRFGRREFDPAQSKTGMGSIGALKQSSAIVMKIKREAGEVPERIRQCTYTHLDGTTWRGGGGRNSFEDVAIEPDTTTWTLLPEGTHIGAVRIIERVNRRSALLSVPLGTVQLKELMAARVQTNRFQVIRANGNPGLVNFVAHSADRTADSPPYDRLRVDIPEPEEDAIATVARELNIDKDASDKKKISAIVRFFQQNFRYTTYQAARRLGLHASTPLADFLLKTRAGHCEYFASATVLLLRHLGIPARYATGYAVQELSREDDTYVIRERHGHAWALAWVDKKWIEVDSTPAGWELAEEKEFPFYEGLKDEWSRLVFGFLEWRWLGDWGFFRLAAPWLALPMMLFLAWRIFGRRMSHQVTPREAQIWPGEDSEFYLLERRLAKTGFARTNQETAGEWLARIASENPAIIEPLKTILCLHYKYRFNPDGIASAERQQLRDMVQTFLAQL